MTGVSVDIGTSFLKPAGVPGDILKARATVTGLGEYSDSQYLSADAKCNLVAGKTLAFTRVDFTNTKGDLLAYGRTCTSFNAIGMPIYCGNQITQSSSGNRVTIR